MPVDMGKVEREAPQVYSLVKAAEVSLSKQGLDYKRYTAAVVGSADHSGSTEEGGRNRERLYSGPSRIIPTAIDLCFAAGLMFDDDGEVPMSLFDDDVTELGEMNLGNCKRFIDQHRRYGFGGTKYTPVLDWIVETAKENPVLSSAMGGTSGSHRAPKQHWWQRQSSPAPTAQGPAVAPYPTFGYIITDGEPQQSLSEILARHRAYSGLPVFFLYIGVGNADFKTLKAINNDTQGRVINNVDFFDAKEVGHDANRMAGRMLENFVKYYERATERGIIAPKAS